VTINNDLALVADGEPFFPFAFCGMTIPDLKNISAMGCNTVWTFRARALPPKKRFLGLKGVEEQLVLFDEAHAQGLKVIAC
jgi:hypothetical protein